MKTERPMRFSEEYANRIKKANSETSGTSNLVSTDPKAPENLLKVELKSGGEEAAPERFGQFYLHYILSTLYKETFPPKQLAGLVTLKKDRDGNPKQHWLRSIKKVDLDPYHTEINEIDNRISREKSDSAEMTALKKERGRKIEAYREKLKSLPSYQELRSELTKLHMDVDEFTPTNFNIGADEKVQYLDEIELHTQNEDFAIMKNYDPAYLKQKINALPESPEKRMCLQAFDKLEHYTNTVMRTLREDDESLDYGY